MGMSEQAAVTPGDSAKDEAARQAVILLFSVAGVLLMVAAQRAAGNPDFYRGLRMRWAKAVERTLARVAARSWAGAEQARRWYEDDSA